ncbi:hypothetical protein F3Y22_tig00005265pilonHSYRG00016 [Hibiscus syriacus]|uniref:GEM-like protein 1 n=1 Tax=Hibiscus syriacus TaxID=106335 RepID=A0A6A3CF71_HIBSY|nr:hypothetical protein F3Y22_tig00005265pilonHSYRG00016 [Hibiscus syriacus]
MKGMMSQPPTDHGKISEPKSTQPPTVSSDYAPYPKLDPTDVAPTPQNWSSVSMGSQSDSNPHPAPISTSAAPPCLPSPILTCLRHQFNRLPSRVAYWLQFMLKTGPSFADAAVGKIAQTTKVIADGGYEKIFGTTFETVPAEKLLKTYACYLSPRLVLLLEFYTCRPKSLLLATTHWHIKLVTRLNIAIISAVKNLQGALQPRSS